MSIFTGNPIFGAGLPPTGSFGEGRLYYDTSTNPFTDYVYRNEQWNLCGIAGSGTPGGAGGQVQYNSGGAFAGVSGATSDGTKLTLTNPVLNGTVTGTAAASGQSANTLVLRDANQNISVNNVLNSSSTFNTLGNTVNLTVSSPRQWQFTGTLTQGVQLPNATTLKAGASYYFNNNSSGLLTIKNAGGVTLCTVQTGASVQVSLFDASTANGIWDEHYLLPPSAVWGTGGLILPNSSTGLSSGALWNNAGTPTIVP